MAAFYVEQEAAILAGVRPLRAAYAERAQELLGNELSAVVAFFGSYIGLTFLSLGFENTPHSVALRTSQDLAPAVYETKTEATSQPKLKA